MVAETSKLIRMYVQDVRRKRQEGEEVRKHILVLREINGERMLPIWIGAAEAIAMAIALQKPETPRPMTYQFMANVLQATGAVLREVRVAKLEGNTFFAEVVLDHDGNTAVVDARTSDAINLALVASAPILVDPDVIARAAGAGDEAPPMKMELEAALSEEGEGAAEILAAEGPK